MTSYAEIVGAEDSTSPNDEVAASEASFVLIRVWSCPGELCIPADAGERTLLPPSPTEHAEEVASQPATSAKAQSTLICLLSTLGVLFLTSAATWIAAGVLWPKSQASRDDTELELALQECTVISLKEQEDAVDRFTQCCVLAVQLSQSSAELTDWPDDIPFTDLDGEVISVQSCNVTDFAGEASLAEPGAVEPLSACSSLVTTLGLDESYPCLVHTGESQLAPQTASGSSCFEFGSFALPNAWPLNQVECVQKFVEQQNKADDSGPSKTAIVVFVLFALAALLTVCAIILAVWLVLKRSHFRELIYGPRDPMHSQGSPSGAVKGAYKSNEHGSPPGSGSDFTSPAMIAASEYHVTPSGPLDASAPQLSVPPGEPQRGFVRSTSLNAAYLEEGAIGTASRFPENELSRMRLGSRDQNRLSLSFTGS